MTTVVIPPPTERPPVKRYRVTLDYEEVIEAQSAEDACREAAGDISGYDFEAEEIGTTAPDLVVAPVPESWREPMARVCESWRPERYLVGGLHWATNGHVMLLLPPDAPVAPEKDPEAKVRTALSDEMERVEPTELREGRNEWRPMESVPSVRIGAQYFSQRYAWLIGELFGAVEWWQHRGAKSGQADLREILATRDGEVVAVLMPVRV